jgi:hypothetical protein
MGRSAIEVGDGVYLFTPSQLDAFMAEEVLLSLLCHKLSKNLFLFF